LRYGRHYLHTHSDPSCEIEKHHAASHKTKRKQKRAHLAHRPRGSGGATPHAGGRAVGLTRAHSLLLLTHRGWACGLILRDALIGSEGATLEPRLPSRRV